MNIVLFAHQNWGVEAIRVIQDSQHKILHVFTHPPNMDPHEKIWYESVNQECEKFHIPTTERTKIKEDDVELITKLSPDLIFAVGWRRLIPPSIFLIPKYGSINLHDGLLPKYRGFAPLNWALINGENEAGITIHYLGDEADTGDIILQRKTEVNLTDKTIDVYKELLQLTPSMILETLSLIESNNVKAISQSKKAGFFCARRFPDDGKISWSENRVIIYNLIRALDDPYPNAFCFYEGEKIFVNDAKLIDEDFRGDPGKICSIEDNGIIVTCGNNHKENQAILITKITVNGKKQNPKEFFHKLWSILK